MKYFCILLLALFAHGCRKKAFIEFTGNTPGIKNGVFIVKTLSDSTVFGENIKDGKFAIGKESLKAPGYYNLNVTNGDSADSHSAFEVYLEDGKYSIETEAGKLYKYPKITSPSKIQAQLSAFYTLSDSLDLDANREIKRLNNEISVKGNKLSAVAYAQLVNLISQAKIKTLTNNVTAFTEFLKRYPDNVISAHLMAKLNYEDDPVSYYAIYKTLKPEAKNSDEGKEIGDRLSILVKLVPGVKAPDIIGKLPDGKPFDQKSVATKFILVDFWRAGNDFSRRNHTNLINLLGEMKGSNKLAILSVSLDSKQDWWSTAIAEDHMTWTQVSDLKGDDSPNAANWGVTTIPTYYLLDSNWNIVERNINIGNIDFEVSDYIKKHP
jgi:hypothetical protein